MNYERIPVKTFFIELLVLDFPDELEADQSRVQGSGLQLYRFYAVYYNA